MSDVHWISAIERPPRSRIAHSRRCHQQRHGRLIVVPPPYSPRVGPAIQVGTLPAGVGIGRHRACQPANCRPADLAAVPVPSDRLNPPSHGPAHRCRQPTTDARGVCHSERAPASPAKRTAVLVRARRGRGGRDRAGGDSCAGMRAPRRQRLVCQSRVSTRTPMRRAELTVARVRSFLAMRSGPDQRAAGARPPLVLVTAKANGEVRTPRGPGLSRGVWAEPGHATTRSARRFRPSVKPVADSPLDDALASLRGATGPVRGHTVGR